MVTRRTITLTFSWGTSTKDADGFATGAAAPSTLAILCRPEPKAPSRKALAPNGEYVEVQFIAYADPFTDTLPRGARVTYLGRTYTVLMVHQYQKNAEIWMA